MSITELLAFIKQIRTNGKGVTAMEYGVIAAAVIIAISAIMTTVGKKLTNTFSNINTALGS
jgi:pilus assembly protein Flp/PilA